jgi:protease-4
VSFTKSSNHVAVVYAEGEIVDGWGDPDQVGGDRLAHYLRDIRSNKQIKAVVLRINSPGGSAFASDIIAREILLLRKKGIPVVVSMGDVAASGGYYIAARGTKILANNSTITGSIGVFGLHFNFEELAKKINLGVDGSKTSRYADLLSSHRVATPDEIALVQKLVDRVYDDFVGIVAEGRSLERDKVHAIAQGRVWLGLNAKENGLVDSFGNLTDAIHLSQKLAKIDQAEIVQYPSLHEGRSNFLQKLLSDEEEEPFLFTSTATNNPAMQFIRAHWDRLKQIKSYNDPQGVYLTCPMQVGEK